MTLKLRYMRLSDIGAVVAIDRLSFDVAWSAQAYHFEVNESNYSHMVVLEDARPMAKPKSTLERIIRSVSGGGLSDVEILGYGGLWNIAGEAHISTIAVHPRHRGNGYGELLLAGMMTRSVRLRAAYVILEVRVSNSIAQSLYRKYGFETKTIKERYYQSDGEDAYEMRFNLTSEAKERTERQFASLVSKYQVADEYTARQPSRRL